MSKIKKTAYNMQGRPGKNKKNDPKTGQEAIDEILGKKLHKRDRGGQDWHKR